MYYIFSSQLLNDSLTSTLDIFSHIKIVNDNYPWYNNDLEAMKSKLRKFEKNI